MHAWDVRMQVSDLAGFMCTEGEITHKYKYKLLRAAFSHLPGAKEAAVQMPTKVTARLVIARGTTADMANMLVTCSWHAGLSIFSSWCRAQTVQPFACGILGLGHAQFSCPDQPAISHSLCLRLLLHRYQNDGSWTVR